MLQQRAVVVRHYTQQTHPPPPTGFGNPKNAERRRQTANLRKLPDSLCCSPLPVLTGKAYVSLPIRSYWTAMIARWDRGGYCSETDRAKWVRQYLDTRNVDLKRVNINDVQRAHRSHREVVRVCEGFDCDMSPSQFGTLMSAVNRLVNDHPDSRFAPGDDDTALIAYEHVDREMQTAGWAGRELADPSEVEQGSERFEISDTTAMTDENQQYDVTHLEANVWAVYDSENSKTWRVDLAAGNGAVNPILGDGEPDQEAREAMIGAVIAAGPEYREGPREHLSVSVEAPAAGSGSGGSGNASSSGSDDDSDQNSSRDVVSDPPSDHDYGAEELEDAVNQWLTNHAELTDGMIDGAWSCEFAELYDSDSDSEELGVHIDISPWHGPLWDSDNYQFDTDDGSQPEEWADHRDAMKDIFSSDSKPVEGIPEDNEETGYTDWYNYVPADEAVGLGD